MASSWHNENVARQFLDERRAAIPYAGDQIALLLQLIAHFRGAPRRLLDLGCGDGLLARSVLSVYPEARAVLLDHSGPMLARAWKAMERFDDRAALLQADLSAPLATAVGTEPFDLIVSGFAIHHLADERNAF